MSRFFENITGTVRISVIVTTKGWRTSQTQWETSHLNEVSNFLLSRDVRDEDIILINDTQTGNSLRTVIYYNGNTNNKGNEKEKTV